MSTELLLAIIGITAAPVTSWLASKLTRQKYNTEIARLRAEVAAARADANRKELENVRVGNEIIMQNIVHPLEVQVKRLNTNVSRLEKAVGKISLCPHAADCPVSHELRKHKNATIRSTTTSNLEHAADYGEETETSNTESLEAVGDRHEQTDTETTTELTSNEEVTTTVREYDTDKPTDPVTGTPPLKRETTQTRRKTDAGRQTQTTGQTIDEHRELSGESSSREAAKTELQTTSGESTHTDTDTETHERRGLNPLQRLLCTLGGIAVAAGVVWLVWKLKRHL
jgi:hypothetical protein